jgi:hypothetical protein
VGCSHSFVIIFRYNLMLVLLFRPPPRPLPGGANGCHDMPRPAKSSGGRSIKGDEEVRGFTSPWKTGTISLAFPFFFLFIINNGQQRGLDLNWFSDFLKTDFYYLWGWSMLPCLQDTQRQNVFSSRDGILGQHCDKRPKSFSLCYSQSLLLADFTENHTLLWF